MIYTAGYSVVAFDGLEVDAFVCDAESSPPHAARNTNGAITKNPNIFI
ncbi:hypothetical protein AAFM48_25175 [Burkholderia pseudomallei]